MLTYSFICVCVCVCVCVSSHCITGPGFQGQFAGGEGEEDESLSTEGCYECKINGGAGGKNERHRRNAEDNKLGQVGTLQPYPPLETQL